VYVTNGYMTPEMLELAIPTMDAANVDIKAFDDAVHRRYTGRICSLCWTPAWHCSRLGFGWK